MLIEYGNTTVGADWKLDEAVPTSFSRIYYVTSGDVTYESGGVTRPLKPGYVYALPSTMPYRVWRNPAVSFRCTYLHVCFPRSDVNGLIELNAEENTCLSHYIQAIRKAIDEKRIELLEQMADSFALFLRGSEHFSRGSEMISAVRDYIMRHISENLTIESLSQLFSYHPNYFIRYFRQETGYTPYQFIMQQRMQYAVVLLNRGMRNEEVCFKCGYADSSTFTRAFRKYYGVTPHRYVNGFRKP